MSPILTSIPAAARGRGRRMNEWLPGRWIAILTAMLALSGSVFVVRLFIVPETDSPAPVDAIFVLAGAPDRLPTALQLLQAGWAGTIVLSLSGDPERDDRTIGRVRAAVPAAQIQEFVADPSTTRGEARAIGKLIAENGWKSAIVVTSVYHVARARLLVARCTGAQVLWIASTPGTEFVGWGSAVAHELGGFTEAALRPDC